MRKDTVNILLVVAIIVGLGVLAVGFIADVGYSLKSVETVAKIVQAVAAAAAIGLGAVFAYRNSILFRTFIPHLNLSHAVSHRRVGNSYLHITVVATLSNSSRVQVAISQGYFQLLQVSPIDDNHVRALYDEAFPDNESGEMFDIQWPVIHEVPFWSHAGKLLIEPGQSHSEIVEFIVRIETESVLVYSYFANAMANEATDSTLGWDLTTPYDIIIRK